jgi:hypothetical protein
MTTDAFHPDHLKPGHMVGPWRILESLGSGSSGHAFKVECEGEFFTLKMAVRPAPDSPRLHSSPDTAPARGLPPGGCPKHGGLVIKNEGSKPNQARLPREWSAMVVRRWP